MQVWRKLSGMRTILLCGTVLSACPSWGQQEVVSVSVKPEQTDWAWQDYAEKMARLFAGKIEDRVRKGLPRREFVLDSTATVLSFLFRVSGDGNLKKFVEMVPEKRYTTYLILRTAREIARLDPLPRDYPYFHFDGTIIFQCRFQPTGRYKRFYFEEPLDSLQSFSEIQLVPLVNTDESLVLYDPPDVDKKLLLEDYRKRIGVAEPIADTSSYTPVDFAGRRIAVLVSHDSLTGGGQQADYLRESVTEELKHAGALISVLEEDLGQYLHPPQQAVDSVPGAADSAALVSRDSTVADSSGAKPQGEPVKPYRKLEIEAFSKNLNQPQLLLCLSLVPDNSPGRGLCRALLFPPGRPANLKRQIVLSFSYKGTLPDTLGAMVVKRMTNPPPKPKPEAAAAKAQPSKQAGPDSLKALTAGRAASPVAAAAAKPQSAPRADSSAAAPPSPPSPAPSAAPPDSAKGVSAGDSSAPQPAPPVQEQPGASPPTPPDSAKPGPNPS